ncbi:MAG: hypothetical protein JNL97_13345 [Verrucomicrobiales bacterium]|nr:hypothetical protein [Verrucomicrobiales bacterium]
MGYTPVTDPAVKPGMFRVRGDSEFAVDSAEWLNPVSPCSARSAPASGRVLVDALVIVGLVTDLRSLVVRTDEELPTPRLELYLDPFLPSPTENFVLTCPPAPPVPFLAGFWAAGFGALHRGELVKTYDGKSVYRILDFRRPSVTEPYRRDYQWTGKADAMDVSETTTFSIRYLGSE